MSLRNKDRTLISCCRSGASIYPGKSATRPKDRGRYGRSASESQVPLTWASHGGNSTASNDGPIMMVTAICAGTSSQPEAPSQSLAPGASGSVGLSGGVAEVQARAPVLTAL